MKEEDKLVDGLLDAFVPQLMAMSDEQRGAVMEGLAKHFCLLCGNTHLPCHCWRDE